MAISELINSKKKLNMRCLFLLGILLVIYAVENYFQISLRTNPAFVYIGKPVLWLAAITAVLSFPRVTAQSKLRLMSTLRWLTVLLSGAYIVILIIIGFIAGFAKSPYSHSAFGIITNLISVYTALAGRELIRNYLINSRKSRNNLTLALVTVLMTLTSLSVDSIIGLRTKTDMIEYIGLNFLPGLSGNILASYLVSIGGPTLPIIYIGIQQCFDWLFPVLPDLNPVIAVLTGTLCPLFSLMFLKYYYQSHLKAVKNYGAKAENPLGWVVTVVISISVVWFCTGVFPVRPLIIATGSMEPMLYPGDMVLVKNVNIKELKVGDVVQYKKDNIFIFHRIIDIAQDDLGQVVYRTKGDNNTIPDPDPVSTKSIKGKVVYSIPKIGWPVLFIKSSNDVDRNKVEF